MAKQETISAGVALAHGEDGDVVVNLSGEVVAKGHGCSFHFDPHEMSTRLCSPTLQSMLAHYTYTLTCFHESGGKVFSPFLPTRLSYQRISRIAATRANQMQCRGSYRTSSPRKYALISAKTTADTGTDRLPCLTRSSLTAPAKSTSVEYGFQPMMLLP